jgi:DNA polymerase III delta subunit
MRENVYFIFGADEFFVELRAKKYLEEHMREFSTETIDGTVHTIADLKLLVDRVAEALQTADFFTPNKCVWLRATNILATGSPATSEGGQPSAEKFLSLLQRLPSEVHLVISASPVDKRMRLFKTLQSLSVCEEMEEKQSETYLRFLIKKLCKEQNITIDADACELLFQKMNRQPRAIANEFEKLACAKQWSGSVTLEDVQTYTPTLMNNEFFEPVEAFYAKDTARYVRSLRQHFILNKEMRSVWTMFQNRNRLLIQSAALGLKSISKTTLDKAYTTYERDFGAVEDKNTFCIFSQNPWYVSRLKTTFSLQTLLEIQKALVEIFDQMLSYPKQACAWMEGLVRFF